MKKGLISVNKAATKENTVESYVCFEKFADFLENKAQQDKTIRAHFYRLVLDKLKTSTPLMEGVCAEDSQQYEDMLQLVSSIVLPLMDEEDETLVALTVGLSPVAFYSTEAFSKLFDPSNNTHPPYSSMEDEKAAALHKQVQYDLVLQKIYRRHLPDRTEMIRSFFDETTGLYKYYRLHIDSRFLDVRLRAGCRVLNQNEMADYFECGGANDIDQLLPLQNFVATGFCIITLTDITEQQALEQLSKVVLNFDKENAGEDFNHIQRLLQTIVGSSDYHFGIMPFFTINNRAALLYENFPYSILVKASADAGIPRKTFNRYINHYLTNPGWIDYTPGSKTNLAVKLQQALDKKGIFFYGLAPVYFNNVLVGIMESGAAEGIPPFNDIQYSKLKPVIPYISQLLKISIDNFNIAIDRIVKDRFTVIQSSVQWKFNEAAWHYYRSHDVEHLNTAFDKISFRDVYPLYGAVDIRNSTNERNNALRRDLQLHLDLLINLLQQIAASGCRDTAEPLLVESNNWLRRMDTYVSVEQELKLNNFLFGEVDPFLQSVKPILPDVLTRLEDYYAALDENSGIAYNQRRQLEHSMQQLNMATGKYFDLFKEELQIHYPCYFEKFRTDGIEYDIYIGQSIAPKRPFTIDYLYRLQAMQVQSMAAIAKLTAALYPTLEYPLQTTQLIFVNSRSIDISFREDERRFDVEGAYNIRYQVIKKRIDKVRILDTGERLTQPGKIAIVYFNEEDILAYKNAIKHLQAEEIVSSYLEELELEDLQGVAGLKALRVDVLE